MVKCSGLEYIAKFSFFSPSKTLKQWREMKGSFKATPNQQNHKQYSCCANTAPFTLPIYSGASTLWNHRNCTEGTLGHDFSQLIIHTGDHTIYYELKISPLYSKTRKFQVNYSGRRNGASLRPYHPERAQSPLILEAKQGQA